MSKLPLSGLEETNYVVSVEFFPIDMRQEHREVWRWTKRFEIGELVVVVIDPPSGQLIDGDAIGQLIFTLPAQNFLFREFDLQNLRLEHLFESYNPRPTDFKRVGVRSRRFLRPREMSAIGSVIGSR